MKFFIAIALIAAVASASLHKPTQLSAEEAQIAEIVAAIQSPSTDPATAAALEALLLDVMGVQQPSPVGVESSPISVGPAFIDFPLPDGGHVDGAPAVNPSPVVQPSPVVIGELPAGATPLVQIIVNVNSQESVVAPAPVDSAVVEEVFVPGPVNIVDNFSPETVVDPIQVVNPVVVEPVQVVTPVVVEPVQVVNPVVVPGPVNIVDNVVVEPVVIGTPIIPAPVVVLPEELN